MMNLVLVAAFTAGAVLTEPPAQPATQPDPAAQKHAEKKICRRVIVTGSITPKRDCHTQAEWAELAKAGEDDVRKMQDNSRRPGY